MIFQWEVGFQREDKWGAARQRRNETLHICEATHSIRTAIKEEEQTEDRLSSLRRTPVGNTNLWMIRNSILLANLALKLDWTQPQARHPQSSIKCKYIYVIVYRLHFVYFTSLIGRIRFLCNRTFLAVPTLARPDATSILFFGLRDWVPRIK